MFGATGFTGQLAVNHLARTYGDKIKWAIAGRRREALEEVRSELAKICPSLKDLPILIADTSRPDTLKEVVSATRVVITTVGPYARYGTPLVEMCAAYGTSYCDITGESDWVREMIDCYDDLARKSGARIVHFCGHDCVPWDLSTLAVAQELKKNGESLKEVRCYDEIRSSPSGGTMETIFNAIKTRGAYKASVSYDPMVRTVQGTQSESKTIARNQNLLGYSTEYGRWVGPFLMASVMANCVRRSNAVNGYGKKLKYKEAMVYPSFFAGFVNMVGNVIFGTVIFCAPLAYLLRRFVLPKPGEGPSAKTMDDGFLKITCIGTGDKGGEAKTTMYFPTCPGYRDTARMLVESGLALALDSDKISAPGGIWTPASCQGTQLIKRLENTGTIFSIE